MANKNINGPTADSQKPESTGAEKTTAVYEKPRILFRQTLEAAAAVCDPLAGGKDIVPDNCSLFAGS